MEFDYITIGVTCTRCSGTGIDPEHKTFNVESQALYAWEDKECGECAGQGMMPIDILEEE